MGTDKENAMFPELLAILRKSITVKISDKVPQGTVYLVGIPDRSLDYIVACTQSEANDIIDNIGRVYHADGPQPALPKTLWLHRDIVHPAPAMQVPHPFDKLSVPNFRPDKFWYTNEPMCATLPNGGSAKC
jgi:hypothetical protein